MNKRILLADDSRTIQQVVKLCLADDVVEVATDAAGAIARARQSPPDLLLVDHRLPGQDGYSFGQALLQDNALSAIPRVLLYSAFGTVNEAAARAAGYAAWCPKPFDTKMLLDSMELALQAMPPLPASVPEPMPEIPVTAEAADAEFELTDLTAAEPEPEFEVEPEPAPAMPTESAWLEPAAEPAPAPAAGEEEGAVWSDLSFAAEDLAVEVPAEDFQLESAAEVAAEDFSFTPQAVEPVAAAPFTWEQSAPTEPPVPFELSASEDMVLDEAPVAKEEIESAFFAEEDVLDLDESDILAVEDTDWQPAFEASSQPTEPVMPVAEDMDSIFSQVVEAEPEIAPLAEPLFFEAVDEVAFIPAEAPAEGLATPASSASSTPTADLERQLRAMPEADLRALLERVAQPLLERIAWEVVPDLAESLIREEIRKIRETAA